MIVINFDINAIIEQIPAFCEYLVPGFIFIILFQYFTSRKIKKYIIGVSIAISYFLRALCLLFIQIFFYFSHIEINDWYIRAILLCLVSVSLSLLCIKISESESFSNWFFKVNYKTQHDDIWSDIIDYKNGTTLRIYCTNRIYTGRLHLYEEKGKDSWLCLSDYLIEENGKTYDSEDMGYPAKLAIRFSDIEYIELFYKKEKSDSENKEQEN